MSEEHPWEAFLQARAACILLWLREGQTPDRIARTLSMDGDQVVAIAMSALLHQISQRDRR